MKSVIETSITPVVLISANALFLLTLANRYSNLTTRIRQLSDTDQLQSLHTRVLILKTSVVLNILSIVLDVVAVMVLLVSALLSESEQRIAAAYILLLSLVFMLVSCLIFLRDILLSSDAIYTYVTRQVRSIEHECV